MKNNLEPVNSLLEFSKNFKPGKTCKIQDDFWKNMEKKRKQPLVSMMTIEKIHYLRMVQTINKTFYEK